MKRYLTTENILRYFLLLAVVLPLFIFRDFTRNNELRYLVIADEALRDGHIFTFYNQEQVYADKPPLYLWVIMLGKTLFGKHSMLFLGMFSMIPAIVILWIMSRWTRMQMPNPSQRSATQLMLLTSAFFFLCAGMVRMDMLMCMFIVLALYTFFRIYSEEDPKRRRKYRILFPVWIFMAVFSKGPIGILVPLISTIIFLIWKKEWRKIGYYWGWLTWGILLLLSGSWFLAVYLEGGNEYLENLLFKQTAGRAVNANHHRRPFWYYGISIWYSLAPWALLLMGSLITGIARWKKIAVTDLERFFLTIALSTLVMLSAISSKINIYILPALPFFVYLGSLWLEKIKQRKWMLWSIGIPAGAIALALPAALVAAPKFWNGSPGVLIWCAVGVFSFSGMACVVSLCKGKLFRAIHILAGGILLTLFVGSFGLKPFNPYIGMEEISLAAKEAAERKGIDTYYCYEISRGENMEAFLGTDLLMYDRHTGFPETIQTPAVLIGRYSLLDAEKYPEEKPLQEIVRKHATDDIRPIGQWFFIVIPDDSPEPTEDQAL